MAKPFVFSYADYSLTVSSDKSKRLRRLALRSYINELHGLKLP